MTSTRGVCICICKVCVDVRARLNNIFHLLEKYGWLLDTYIVDFFQDNVWSKLPSAWRKALDDVSPEELGEWASGTSLSTRVWPLSLLAFRKTIETLVINRDYTSNEVIECMQRKNFDPRYRTNDSSLMTRGKLIVDSEYKKLFHKSVKMKKIHEIENIAETAFEGASTVKCECIVDIGAGMGHLARTLAYNYGLSVVCLEQDESLSQQARNCDEKLLELLRKKNSQILEKCPHHIQTKVTEADINDEELTKKLKNEFTKNFNLSENNIGYGLIGLHSCGDLTATLLKFYANQNDAKFICIVGCCYMKITCGSKEIATFGYPLSRFASNADNHELSYAALEVACHAIESYCDKLKSGNYHDLMIHAYRATLETILIRKNGASMRRSHLKNVKLKEPMSFDRYCSIATENLSLGNKPDQADTETIEVKNFLNRWRQVVAFETLRFMLAPLVETAILFDRFLYISENNLSPILRPIFDPRLSPRNIVLISSK